MDIKFGKFEQTATLENLGSLAKFLGPKGSISVTANGIKGKTKENGATTRVFVIMDKGDGNGTALLNCSKAVSDGVRAKTIKVSDLLHYEILVAEVEGNKVPYLSIPSGDREVFTVKVSEAKAAPAPAKVKWSELVAS